MQYGIAFTPLVPAIVLWIALAAIVAISALLLLGARAAPRVRVAALALILLALANPSFTREDREPLSVGRRGRRSTRARARISARATRRPPRRRRRWSTRLKKIKGLEVRGRRGRTGRRRDRRHQAVRRARPRRSSDVPVDRVAGAFLITDGRVHDIPANAAALGFQAPVHALLTGRKDERDRRIAIFGRAALRHRRPAPDHHASGVDDQGVTGQRAASRAMRRDGEADQRARRS